MKYIYYLLAILFITTGLYSQSDSIPRVKESVVVSNDIGNSTVLEFGLDSLASDDFDFQFGEANLPPLPPPTAWDTRLLLPEGGFSGVKSSLKDYRNAPSFPFTGSREHRIQYQVGNGTTVTISWNFPQQITGLLQDIVTGTLINVPMNDSGNYTVAQPSIFNKLKMTIDYQYIIPVELVSFVAIVNGSKVNLTWQTATELNNGGFEIQKSIDKSNWNAVAFVNGNGTTTEVQNYSYTDNLTSVTNQTLYYRLKQIDFDGSYFYSNVIEVEVDLTPTEYTLYQNYPNPFNSATTIKYALPYASNVKIVIYNMLGETISELFNGMQEAGYYETNWDANLLASGIYFYSIQAKSSDGQREFKSIKKMLLMK